MSERAVDVAVIGLGAMGAMTAWRAAAAGASVVGVERFDVGHDRGSSHGGSRIFRMILFEGPEYVPIARRSHALFRELEDVTGAALLQTCGGVVIGPDGGEIISDAITSARAGEVEHELLDTDTLRARFPQHAAFDDDVAVYEPGAGVIRPEATVTAAVEAARGAGAEIVTGVQIEKVTVADDGVEVRMGSETVRARRIVLAAGAWFSDLVPQLGLPLRNQRSCLAWFTARSEPEAYRPDRFPVFVRESGHLDAWGIPDVDGRGVKVGVGGSASKPWLDRPEDNWYDPTEADLAPIEALTDEAFPGLVPTVASAAACMNSKTPDGHFVIGHAPDLPRVVLAGGFSGHGFKHAAGVGDIASSLALDGASDIPLDRFAPDRFTAPE